MTPKDEYPLSVRHDTPISTNIKAVIAIAAVAAGCAIGYAKIVHSVAEEARKNEVQDSRIAAIELKIDKKIGEIQGKLDQQREFLYDIKYELGVFRQEFLKTNRSQAK